MWKWLAANLPRWTRAISPSYYQKKTVKALKNLFQEYLVHKNLQRSQNATELAEILKLLRQNKKTRWQSLLEEFCLGDKVWFDVLQYFWMYDKTIIGYKALHYIKNYSDLVITIRLCFCRQQLRLSNSWYHAYPIIVSNNCILIYTVCSLSLSLSQFPFFIRTFLCK